MNARVMRVSIPLLRWALGVAVLLESGRFLLSGSAASFLAKTGLPWWIRPALGGAEIIAAILFLVPITTLLGAYGLLVVFGLAALVHLLHGQLGIEGLAVYGAAVLVCMAHGENKSVEAFDDRTRMDGRL